MDVTAAHLKTATEALAVSCLDRLFAIEMALYSAETMRSHPLLDPCLDNQKLLEARRDGVRAEFAAMNCRVPPKFAKALPDGVWSNSDDFLEYGGLRLKELCQAISREIIQSSRGGPRSDAEIGLINQYIGMGYRVVDCKMTIADADEALISRLEGLKETEDYGHSLDVRRLSDDSVALYFPRFALQEIVDALGDRALDATHESIAPAIPGLKDITDVRARYEQRRALQKEMSSPAR